MTITIFINISLAQVFYCLANHIINSCNSQDDWIVSLLISWTGTSGSVISYTSRKMIHKCS